MREPKKLERLPESEWKASVLHGKADDNRPYEEGEAHGAVRDPTVFQSTIRDA